MSGRKVINLMMFLIIIARKGNREGIMEFKAIDMKITHKWVCSKKWIDNKRSNSLVLFIKATII